MPAAKGLTDIPGLLVGHASDFEGLTGCTVILCGERGAVCGVDIRGSASGTQETPTLAPDHITDRIHALLLTGGSAFGLEAAAGVRTWLESKGRGFDMRVARVPIVPAAVIFDLHIGKASARPDKGMGLAAAAAANEGPVAEGNIGAGTGATVGKILGITNAMKGGVGTATVELEGPMKGILVSALAVVNAVGDVRDPATGRILAGARKTPDSREFLNTAEARKRGVNWQVPTGSNTTLVAVATNAKLSKIGCTKVAQLAHAGLTRAIWPAHTTMDGDTAFCLSLGERQADVNAIGIAAAEATEQAILRAVRAAATLGGVPGLKRA